MNSSGKLTNDYYEYLARVSRNNAENYAFVGEASLAKLLHNDADAIEDLLIREYPRWTTASKPPEEDGKYITLFADGSVSENHYIIFEDDGTHQEGGKWYHNYLSMGGVTHWMVFSEPPKDE